MRDFAWVRLGLVGMAMAAVFGGCSCGSDDPDRDFFAPLNSRDAVPQTGSQACADLEVDIVSDGDRIEYSALVVGIGASDVIGAHIHIGLPGETGPVIFVLDLEDPIFGNDAPTILEGSLRARDLIPSPEAQVLTFDDAVDAIRNGQAYADIHTDDYPDVEIRGPIFQGNPFDDAECGLF